MYYIILILLLCICLIFYRVDIKFSIKVNIVYNNNIKILPIISIKMIDF